MLHWLRRECFATLAMIGAALTVLGQLGKVMPLALWLQMLLDLWQRATSDFWYLPITGIGVPLHHD